MSNQKIVTETALSALASDIKTALSGKANSNDVYTKSQTYNRTEIDNALGLKADKSELYNVYPTDKESGAIAHFTDGADNIPVKSLVSEIVAVQAGSGVPSPDNVRAISGFDSGVITRCGVNLWDEEWETGTINAQGKPVGDLNNIRSKNFIGIKGSMTIYGVCPNSLLAYYYDKNKNFISGVSDITNRTETTPLNACYMKIRTGGYGGTYNNDISINYPSSDTQYHAYNGNTYEFEFGQTVYGGHFDNKGNLVVTNGYIEFDGSNDESWQMYSVAQGTLFRAQSALKNYLITADNTLCNTYTPTYDRTDLTLSGSGAYFDFINNSISNVNDWRMYLSNKPITVCYKLANPIVLSITSQDIPTLLGENNIFSNTGDVEVEYHADIGLYIDKKISSLAQG